MPYDPGIRNISGELLAQGQMRQAEGIAGGLVNWLKGYEQNQSLKKQGMSTFAGALANNPELQQFMDDAEAGRKQVPPELLKAFANAKKGDVDVYDASMLGNFANNFLTTKREAAQEQAIRMQTAGHAVQALGQLADLGFYAKQPGSGISPEDVSNLQRFITSGMGQGNRQPMVAQQVGMTALDQFVRRQAPAGPTPSTDMQQAEPQAEAQPSEPLPEGAIQAGRRSREAQMAEAMQTVQSLPPSQQRRSLNTVLADIQKRDLDLSKNISFNDPAKAAAYAQTLNAQSKTPGVKFVVDTDPRTGYNIVKQVTSSVETPEEAARRKKLETSAELDAKSANEYITRVKKEGAAALDDTLINQQIRNALKSKVETGPIEAFKQNVRKVAIGAGLADKETIDKTDKFDELEGLMMRGQLEFAQNATRGNLNTFEQRLVESAVSNAKAKLPGANAYLNDVVEAIKLKKADHARAEQDFRQQYKDKVDRAEALQDWELNPANSINKYFERLRAESAAPAAQTAAPAASGAASATTKAATGRWDPQKQMFIPY